MSSYADIVSARQQIVELRMKLLQNANIAAENKVGSVYSAMMAAIEYHQSLVDLAEAQIEFTKQMEKSK